MYMQLLQNSLKSLLLEGSIGKARLVLASRTWRIPLSSAPWYMPHPGSWTTQYHGQELLHIKGTRDKSALKQGEKADDFPQIPLSRACNNLHSVSETFTLLH